MPSTLKDGSPLSTPPKDSSEMAPNSGEAQPVALEVPVTVNGARAVEGSEKREPFSENTSTVLVRANGAVIRLSSSVAPGQLLFLTNEKTRKEVVCQVVKSKSHRSASGYVELEFTQPVLGFWGMRFPGERNAPLNTSLPAAQKVDPATVTPAPEISAKTVEAKPASFADTRPTAENFNANLADEVQEFKTEIKADSRPSSKADFLAPNAEPSIDGLKLEANRLQEQLSALLFAENQSPAKPANPVVPPSKQELGDAASKIFDMANEAPPVVVEATPATRETSEPAPAAAAKSTPVKSSFDDEEVKIPAWLEPMARNAAIPAPPAEEVESDSATEFAEAEAPEAAQPGSAVKQSTAPPAPKPKAKSAAVTPRSVPAVAVFGNSLLGEGAGDASRPRGSGKGIWKAAAAALIIVAAGGGWYFRDSLASLVAGRTPSGSNASPVSESSATLPAAAVHSAALEPAPLATPARPDISASDTEKKTTSGRTSTDTPAPISSAAPGKVQAAAITERIPKSNASSDVIGAPATSSEPMEPEIKRTLGKVRLAKPKVGHSASTVNSAVEPSLEASNDALPAGDNGALGGNLLESANQPAAPAAATPVGGDVKAARMISSVPPVYPSLAKAQHVGGDVRIDALIDATGRVTTMKVVSGPSLLHQAAMDALRQWKYRPAMLDGKPVPMHLTVTIVFRLQ